MQINNRNVWVKIVGLLALIFTGWLSINTVYAANCSNNQSYISIPNQRFNIPSYGVTAGKPIGDWIEVNAPYVWNCPAQIYSADGHVYLPSAAMNYSEGGMTYLVLQTGVPGVGVVMASKPSVVSNYVPIVSTAVYWLVPNNGTPRGTGFDMTTRVRFIATSTFTPGSITVPMITAAGSWIYDSTNANIGQALIQLAGYQITVTANTCSVDAGSQNQPVLLDNVTGNDMPSVGSTAKDKVFNVSLTCQSGVYIYAQMNGMQNPDTMADGVLQVSNPGAVGTSTGVGIQILNGSTPMPFRTNMPVRMTSGGNEVIPFTARYYRTLENVSAGTANAIATLNINYQ